MATRLPGTVGGILTALTSRAAVLGRVEQEPDGVRSCRLSPEQVQRLALAMHRGGLGRHFTGRDGTGNGWVEAGAIKFQIGPLDGRGAATLSWSAAETNHETL